MKVFPMRFAVSALISYVVSRFRSDESLRLENIALRHQLLVYQRTVKRPKLRPSDRLFWVWLSRLWPGWQDALEFVQPRTVLTWQKKRFRDYWRRLSQSGKLGRPPISKEARDLIRDMWRSNPTWGSPRIVGELGMLGITVAKSTVEKYRPRIRKPPSPTWRAFLANHVKDIVACDFFTVPTATFKVLFVFIMLSHERRRIVHCNITEHPTAHWTAQQIVEAFPWDTAPRYLLRDRDAIYSASFQSRVENMGLEEVKIAPRSPWQNPYCERVIGSIRRDALDHVIVLNEQHLRRVLRSYVDYYHDWRTHLSLDMDAPESRPVQPPELGPVRKLPEVGCLHHHYERIAA
jgi:transposase InsO family protein